MGSWSWHWKTPLAGVEVQIGSEVDPLLELARVKEEREKVFGKKSNFLRRRGLDPYAGIWTNTKFIDILSLCVINKAKPHPAVCLWCVAPSSYGGQLVGEWNSWMPRWDSLWSPIFRHWPPLHGVWFIMADDFISPEYISEDGSTQQLLSHIYVERALIIL